MESHFITNLPQYSGLYLYIPTEGWMKRYLPCSLTNVKVKVSIVDSVARVLLSQTFANDHADTAYEALYRFPLYENSAVCDFELEHSGRKIKGVVKPEHDAVKTYEKAKAEGKTAALVLQKAPDIFQTKVGNIPPKTSVTVTLTYITPLKHDTEANAIRFTLPTTIAPRYGDASNTGISNVTASGTAFELILEAKMPGQITSISSPSHPITMSLSDTNCPEISLSNSSPALDKDVVVMVAAKHIDEPHCMLETDSTSGTKCAMLTLVPKFNLQRVPTEVIFIIDRSGSMYDKVDTLRRALQLFLKSLPASPEIYFNICSFGSRFDYLFKGGKSKKYDAKTLKVAEDYVSKVDADYGGTEILNPILDCMKHRRTDCQTSIILLTDGEVYNTEAIITSISQERAKHLEKPLRVFSLGIGDSVSHHLVEGIARAGRGYSQLVMPQERLDKKVVRMLSAGLQSELSDLHLDWPGRPASEAMHYKLVKSDDNDNFDIVEKETKTSTTFFDKEAGDQDVMETEPPPEPPKSVLKAPDLQQFPETMPNLYNASRYLTFLLFPAAHPTPQNVTLKGTTPDGTVVSLNIPVTEYTNDADIPVIHTLAARTLLGELEEGRLAVQQQSSDEESLADAVKEEGTQVALKYNLASKWTAFVAVDENPVEGKLDADGGEFDNERSYDLDCYIAKGESLSFGALPRSRSMGGGGLPPPPPAPMRAPGNGYQASASVGGIRASRKSLNPFSSALGTLGSAFKGASKEKKSMSFAPQAAPKPSQAPVMELCGSHACDEGAVRAQEPAERQEKFLSDEDILHEIVMQQASSGAFPSNAALAKHIGLPSIKDANDKLPQDLKGVPADVWMTVLVCLFLELNLAGEKDAWELVVEKAWTYVQAVVTSDQVKELKKAATSVMRG